jgi:signal transduction histidine kinase
MDEETINVRETKEEALRRVRVALLNILEDTEDARKAAVDERNKTMAIIDNLTDGVIFLNMDDKVELASPIVMDFFKKTKEEIIGKDILDLIGLPGFQPLYNVLKDGESRKVKTVLKKEVALSDKMTVEVTTVELKTESEQKGTLMIIRDVSREKVVEALKTEFVSIAAHQLRTPLSAIKWTIRMVLDGDTGPINPEQKELLEKTYESNERMIHLINDLLNVTRIEEGRFLYKQESVQLEDLVGDVVSSSQELLKMKDIKFDLNVPKTLLPDIYADKEKIELVVQNLLENAVKYTPKGGSIVINLRKEGDCALFEIKDDGVGIPKSQQDRIFGKFFRGENVVKMETEGTGLGLYTSKNIIEAHKGKIWFESDEGRGTTFYFSLPFIKVGDETCEVP